MPGSLHQVHPHELGTCPTLHRFKSPRGLVHPQPYLVARNASRNGMLGKDLRLAAVPHPLGPIAKVTRKNNKRRPAAGVKLGTSVRDPQIIAAESDNAIRLFHG